MLNRRGLIGSATAATLATGSAAAAPAQPSPDIARTQYGDVKGARTDGVTVFKGIPYGASTAGAARFHPPAPPQPWRETLDATAFGPIGPHSTGSTTPE